jgi:hypothetical protein
MEDLYYLSQVSENSFLFETQSQDDFCIRVFLNEEAANNYKQKIVELNIFKPSQLEIKTIKSKKLFSIKEDLLFIVKKAVGNNGSLSFYLTNVDNDFNVVAEEELYNSLEYLN